MLQLKDGSIYGLTAYWVEGGELHYFTNYGGANVIPLDRIDLAKTVQLNAAHGQAFVLAAKRGASKSTH
jgi:carbohydrate-selective porin OprB